MSKKWLVIGLVWAILTVAGVVWLPASPSIGGVTVSPAYLVVNTPTEVLFTAHIPDQSVVLNGVKVVQFDASGKMGSSLGVMHDDGRNGDTVAGDKVFSLQMTLNRPVMGQEYYRVVASFSGPSQLVQSSGFTIFIDQYALPADPGEAGNNSVQGIDLDNNFIRDDIQRHIALTFHTSVDTRISLYELARREQQLLLAANREMAYTSAIAVNRAVDCLVSRVGIEQALRLSDDIEARMINTKARALQYSAQQRLLSGSRFQLTPSSQLQSRCS